MQFFCRRLQCCCKRFDSRTAARFGIESYDRGTPEAARNDLRCTGRLAPKNCETFGIFGRTVPQSNGPQLAMQALSRGRRLGLCRRRTYRIDGCWARAPIGPTPA
jgi:hypothetical protein